MAYYGSWSTNGLQYHTVKQTNDSGVNMSSYKKIEKASFGDIKRAWGTLSGAERAVLSSVVRTNGFTALGDLADHGANTGWSGLTYHWECVETCQKNHALLIDWIKNQFDSYGHDLDLATFECWNRYSLVEILLDIFSKEYDFAAPGLLWWIAETGAYNFLETLEG